MFCPRCAAENEEGSRYCVSCGNELSKTSAPARPEPAKTGGFKAGVERLVGTTRRNRMITIGTVAALLVAIIAFIALAPASEDDAGVPQDALTKALDARCVQHKAEIAAAQRRALTAGTLTAVSRYGESMVPIAGEWRTELGSADVPPGRTKLVGALSAALLEVEIEAGTLARVARESNRRGVAVSAARVDAATENVETAIGSLNLQRCGQLSVGQGHLVRQ